MCGKASAGYAACPRNMETHPFSALRLLSSRQEGLPPLKIPSCGRQNLSVSSFKLQCGLIDLSVRQAYLPLSVRGFCLQFLFQGVHSTFVVIFSSYLHQTTRSIENTMKIK